MSTSLQKWAPNFSHKISNFLRKNEYFSRTKQKNSKKNIIKKKILKTTFQIRNQTKSKLRQYLGRMGAQRVVSGSIQGYRNGINSYPNATTISGRVLLRLPILAISLCTYYHLEFDLYACYQVYHYHCHLVPFDATLDTQIGSLTLSFGFSCCFPLDCIWLSCSGWCSAGSISERAFRLLWMRTKSMRIH